MTLENSLDTILVQIGEFGKYQKFTFSLVCLVVIMHSAIHIAFVFTAMDVDYRCKIPGCDGPDPNYNPPWLPNTVPFTDQKPSRCSSYQPLTNTTSNCTASDFDAYQIEDCSSFVYKTNEKSIVQEFDLHCDHNLWKLTLIGTINNVGQFFGLFISGLVSDRYGRRVVLIFGMILAAIIGLIKVQSPTYLWFVIFEFLEAGLGAGTYACGFIIGVELVGARKRVLMGTLVCCCYAVGEVLVAGIAWAVQSWKLLIYAVYSPILLLIGLFWLIPESIRWNLTKHRYAAAKATIQRAAAVNGRTISENLLEKLSLPENSDPPPSKDPLIMIFKTAPLLLRLINCCFCWITCTFLFYGLTLNSVALAGNNYLDFILTSLVEIPAYFACAYFVDKLGRRFSLCGSFFLTGFSCIVFVFLPKDQHYATLVFYLLGKFGATAAFTIAYVITSELFPTGLRQSLMGVCSTFGRIGSMISPQTPLLSHIWLPLPLIMYASMAIVAGLLTLLFPETANTKLPDTIDEAIHIGKRNRQVSK